MQNLYQKAAENDVGKILQLYLRPNKIFWTV